MSGLTTHVLDIGRGVPARGVTVALYRLQKGEWKAIATAATNADGRIDSPFLTVEPLPGEYQLVFHIGEYYAKREVETFLSTVPVRFVLSSPQEHYHVPLLVSPWGYQTYRGS
ncbi:hydroxyisourate hydrolase [Shouchella clausii]|uniref:hydroxyisourate hydrolase n=1 Tax=Shouchella clausii TaxID=79880 RepID=UPI00270A26CB|nr:hydroxyisourate hydrolase [Shouchella clausii]MDO7266740.1 hydroxyisourate hydrolase [Shouchella clausii]MDO7286345.1 hydroxyisourate hydrolase [Shouchella clausii]